MNITRITWRAMRAWEAGAARDGLIGSFRVDEGRFDDVLR
jgi:hypothetical protein